MVIHLKFPCAQGNVYKPQMSRDFFRANEDWIWWIYVYINIYIGISSVWWTNACEYTQTKINRMSNRIYCQNQFHFSDILSPTPIFSKCQSQFALCRFTGYCQAAKFPLQRFIILFRLSEFVLYHTFDCSVAICAEVDSTKWLLILNSLC